MLARAAGGAVAPEDFIWEPSQGLPNDLALGRRVLFLASVPDGGPRDLFRARVRLSRRGRPIRVLGLANLTETPLGDDAELCARGRHVAFVTRAFGAVQGVTLLDRGGDRLSDLPLHSRAFAAVENWLQTGSTQGLGRTEVAFAEPPQEAAIALGDGELAMVLGPPEVAARLDLEGGAITPGADDPFGTVAWRRPLRSKPAAHFAMDLLRELLGTVPADALKAVAFGARSRLVRLAASWRADLPEPAEAGPEPEPGRASWPPAPLRSLFKHPLEAEGMWRPPPLQGLPPVPHAVGRGAPYLMETVIRPDPELPFAEVRLVAIDTRQLELRIEAGFAEPRPLGGPRGRGRIQRELVGSGALEVAAAFNGAFQTRHGAYGMVVDRRILLPPKPAAATVATDVHGRTRMGSWGEQEHVPKHIVSLRQNLDPLLEQGVINPRGRARWGFVFDSERTITERSALCLTRSGFLIYGWGIELTAQTLAKALVMADCRYAIHLDMNPGHVGFSYLAEQDGKLRARLLADEMSIDPERFVRGSPKDFFYLVVRDPRPPQALEAPWEPDGGSQPEPSWLPAVYAAEVERLGTRVKLRAFRPGRFFWDVRPGRRERSARTAEGELGPASHARAMAAIGLGVALRGDSARGLVLDGAVTLPIRPRLGVLTTTAEAGELAMGVALADLAPRGDATELVLLAERGALRSEARRLGAVKQRGAACLLDDGTMLVATTGFDSAEAGAVALLQAGCSRVLELDRGKQHRAFVDRAGTAEAPQSRYVQTVLYALAIAAPGTAGPLR